jgi:hypothetical protein
MTIRRDELRKIDFSDVSSGKRLAPVHPGNALLNDFIEPIAISRYRVAKNIHVPQCRIDLICRGEAAVSADATHATAFHRQRFARTARSDPDRRCLLRPH